MVVDQPCDRGRKFELIDGQQRFTTLWMLCHVWRRSLESFLTVTEDRQILPRLGFAIRPTVNRYLKSLVFTEHDGEEETARNQKMREAVATMEALFKRRSLPDGVSLEEHLEGLSRFVFEKVKLVLTVVPSETDLNKLFEVINNRGVQLQHHEILKARMLDALSEEERRAYAVLWDSCADMGEFLERGLAANSPLRAKDVAQLCDPGMMARDAEPLAKAGAVLDQLNITVQGQRSADALGLDEILISPGVGGELKNVNDEERLEGTTWMRSIIGFPMFLQHTLRIWLFRERRPDLPRILDRELLQLFETHFFYDATDSEQSERCRSFIKLLWELRYLFDKHFIKWIDRGEEEIHMISPLSLSTSDGVPNLSRGRESEKQQGFGLLQSMLYHSQEITTHYWITPLLNFIHKTPQEPHNYYEYLRHLDTYLLGSTIEGSLIERTRSFVEKPWARYELKHKRELRKEHGVSFWHYWFYKLEFVLWYLRRSENSKWRDFRFTAKTLWNIFLHKIR
ncbi:DUF262 domain-containing protein [Modicisalibacter luteus]|uniref:DUF262 domain-containing protein n=1 Tax=Modicisalibacter luteus TaxID=453962 RepID=UPI00362BAD10